MTTPAMDRFTALVIAEMKRSLHERTRSFLTDDGKVRISGGTTTGTVPPSRGGWRDHAHDGTDAQKLPEANTHESLDTDPATAIHWTREMLQDMIAAMFIDDEGDPLPYNDASGTITVASSLGSAWGVLTDGTGGPDSIVFDSFGQVVMVEFPR